MMTNLEYLNARVAAYRLYRKEIMAPMSIEDYDLLRKVLDYEVWKGLK